MSRGRSGERRGLVRPEFEAFPSRRGSTRVMLDFQAVAIKVLVKASGRSAGSFQPKSHTETLLV